MRSLLTFGRAKSAADGFACGFKAKDAASDHQWGLGLLALAGALLVIATASGPALAAGAPQVTRLWSANVGVTGATVKAEITTNESSTNYSFEYGQSTSYGSSVPIPDASLPATGEAVEVGQALTGLQSATTYHYRLVASNSEGTTESADHTFITYAAPAAEEEDRCPNAAARVAGLSANLPDCRAYEWVTPLDKNGGNGAANGEAVMASVSGDRVAFMTRTGFGEADGSGEAGFSQFLSTRDSNSWSTHGITPGSSRNAVQIFGGGTWIWGFSNELDRGVVEGYELPEATGATKRDSLYLEHTVDNALTTITTPLGSEEPSEGLFGLVSVLRGYSGDLGVVTFETSATMLPQTNGTSGVKLYAWNHGTLEVAGVLPDGTIPEGGASSPREEVTALGTLQNHDMVSSDGSRILFDSPTDGSAPRQLYMRKDARSTIRVSESEASTPVPQPENVTFQAASPDGTRVLFTTSDRLTDSDPGGPGTALYLYTDGPDPEHESNLTFITREISGGIAEGYAVPGMSTDGSRIYFIAGGGNSIELWDKGAIRDIANGAPTTDEGGRVDPNSVSVSSDGLRLAFLSSTQLTNQDTGEIPPGTGRKYRALYVYDEPTETITCVSCPPSGAAMTSDATMAASAAGGEEGNPTLELPSHFQSENGRYVFFSTADALVRQDTNKLTDAYEYDADTRKISLLSSGSGETGAWFAAASPSGSDVFLQTSQSFVRGDTDSLVDLYDARIDGGLPEAAVPPPPCAGDECQGIPSAKPDFSTASAGFTGLGNPTLPQPLKAKPRKLSTSSGLTKALKACRKKAARKRLRCEARARKRYRTKKSTRHVSRRVGR